MAGWWDEQTGDANGWAMEMVVGWSNEGNGVVDEQ